MICTSESPLNQAASSRGRSIMINCNRRHSTPKKKTHSFAHGANEFSRYKHVTICCATQNDNRLTSRSRAQFKQIIARHRNRTGEAKRYVGCVHTRCDRSNNVQSIEMLSVRATTAKLGHKPHESKRTHR